MSVISNVLGALPGKNSSARQATFDIGVTFGLWKNHDSWLDKEQYSEYWHELSTLVNSNVEMKIKINDNTVFDSTIKKFENLNITYTLDDTNQNDNTLTFIFANLDTLPIRDDTGVFVSGMFKIDCLRLQGVEITHLLDETMFGVNGSTELNFSTPVYSWMVNNRLRILPSFPNGY